MEEDYKKEEFENMSDAEINSRDDIFSRSVRAGKRTYFFDVKSTRKGEYYLTVTESKKKVLRDGKFQFEKHKIFLYKEDFEKFTESLNETLEYIQSHNVEFVDDENDRDSGFEGLDEFEKKNFDL